MKRWGPWIVAAVIVAQFSVPLVVLTVQQPPARWGWQMYSGLGAVEIVVRDVDGEVLDEQWAPKVLPRAMRPELDWSRHLPERICAVVTGAETVTVSQDGREAVTVPCEG